METDQRSDACRRAAGWAIDRAYGELSPQAERRLLEHVAACAACAELEDRASALAGVGLAGREVESLVRPGVLLAARALRLRSLGLSAVAWSGRVALAFMLALACTQAVRQSPTLAHLPSAVSWLLLFAWTVLHASLLDRLLDRQTIRAARVSSLHGRAVAYGVLAAVALSVALVGTFFSMDGVRHFAVSTHSAGGLPDVVTLLSSGAFLLVGLGMGAKLGRESSPNMLAVLLLYASIMVPALVRRAPSLLRTQDVMCLLCLVGLWGFSGAYLGSLVSRSHDVESPHTA